MAKKHDLETMLEQAQQPFSSPAFDTFTAAWAVSQRKKKAAQTTDRAGTQSTSDPQPDQTQAVENDPEVLRRKTENLFHGPVLDTFTAAWAISKDKIKTRPAPKPDNAYIVRQIIPISSWPGCRAMSRRSSNRCRTMWNGSHPDPRRFLGPAPSAGVGRSWSGLPGAEKR